MHKGHAVLSVWHRLGDARKVAPVCLSNQDQSMCHSMYSVYRGQRRSKLWDWSRPAAPAPGPCDPPNTDVLMYKNAINKSTYLVRLNMQPEVICTKHLVHSLTQKCTSACYYVLKERTIKYSGKQAGRADPKTSGLWGWGWVSSHSWLAALNVNYS